MKRNVLYILIISGVMVGYAHVMAQVTPNATGTVQVLSTSRYRVVVESKLNVRQQPSTQSKVVGALPDGDFVEVYGIKNGWAEIAFHGQHAYIASRYIKPAPVTDEAGLVEEVPSVEANQENALKETDSLEQAQPVKKKSNFHFSADPFRGLFQTHREGKNNSLQTIHFRFSSTLSAGLSNLFSFEAGSFPRFGFGVDLGTQIKADFMPEKMFSETDVGFMALGNSKYHFPSLMIHLLPIGYRTDCFCVSKLCDVKGYVVGGLSVQLPVDGSISFYKGGNQIFFPSQATVNLYMKGGLEITNNAAVGICYLQGFSDVCSGMNAGIKHQAIQLYASFLFDKWKKQS